MFFLVISLVFFSFGESRDHRISHPERRRVEELDRSDRAKDRRLSNAKDEARARRLKDPTVMTCRCKCLELADETKKRRPRPKFLCPKEEYIDVVKRTDCSNEWYTMHTDDKRSCLIQSQTYYNNGKLVSCNGYYHKGQVPWVTDLSKRGGFYENCEFSDLGYGSAE